MRDLKRSVDQKVSKSTLIDSVESYRYLEPVREEDEQMRPQFTPRPFISLKESSVDRKMSKIPDMSKLHCVSFEEDQNESLSDCTDKCEATVILVDDEPFNLIPLVELLKTNYQIISRSFENGWEALAFYQASLQKKCCSRSIKLILTDIHMPEMDGFKFTQLVLATQLSWRRSL